MTMAEYIDRESIYKTLSMENPLGWNNNDLAELFRQAKPADVAPVRHGRWITCENGGYYCSKCGRRVAFRVGHYYCLNCGAKMDVEVQS